MHLVKGSFLCAITLKKRWDVSPALLSQIHMRIMNAVVVVLQTQQCETSQWGQVNFEVTKALVKSSQNKKDHNDVKTAPFLVSFSQLT